MTEQPLVFEKAYTRDNNLILQEAWQYALGHGFAESIGVADPKSIPNLFYLIDGAVEIWENHDYFVWLGQALLKAVIANPRLIPETFAAHQKTLQKLEKIRPEVEQPTPTTLRSMINISHTESREFAILYLSALNQKTPSSQRALALQFRERDHFYDDCNRFLNQCLRLLYPKVEGYEVAVLTSEAQSGNISATVIKERYAHFVYIPGKISTVATLGDFLQDHPKFHLILEHVDQNPIQQQGVRGMAAYPGKVVGAVRVLRRKDQISQLIDGEILVSSMTTPDFVPAMKKAAAIVTDEGGITCHAAIVARELKKPCVIGTKIATKAFKDGDMVEVDANTGVVRRVT